MRITMVAMGQLAKEFGEKRFTFDFPPGPMLADFLKKVGAELAGRIPAVLMTCGTGRKS